MATNKKAKREEELKKAKRNKTITIIAVAAAVVILAGAVILKIMWPDGTKYSDGGQTVHLRANKTFNATLYHNVQYSGTYEEVDGGVNFIYDGQTAFASIQGGVMELPEEWGDDHGHGSTLMKQ